MAKASLKASVPLLPRSRRPIFLRSVWLASELHTVGQVIVACCEGRELQSAAGLDCLWRTDMQMPSRRSSRPAAELAIASVDVADECMCVAN